MTSVDDLDLTDRLREQVDLAAAAPLATVDVAALMRRGRRRRLALVHAPRAVLAAAAVAVVAVGVPQLLGHQTGHPQQPAASAASGIRSAADLSSALRHVLRDRHVAAPRGLLVAVVPKPAGTWVAKLRLVDGAQLEVTVSRTSAVPAGQQRWQCPGEFPCHTTTGPDGTQVTTITDDGGAAGTGGASESFLSESLADLPGGGQVRVVVSSVDPYGSTARRPVAVSEAVQEAIATDVRLRP